MENRAPRGISFAVMGPNFTRNLPSSTSTMAFVNNYTPPAPKPPAVLPDPTKPYDLNFCFPIKTLETDRVKLVPLIVRKLFSHIPSPTLTHIHHPAVDPRQSGV
jgi:hypothetical protein